MHLSLNPLLTVAVVLVAGVAFGALARRVRLPAVTGQIVVGILIGPSVLGILPHSAIIGLRPITHFALGLMAVVVGNHLHFQRLRNTMKRLAWLLLLEATITPLLVFVCILARPDTPWVLGILLAALAVSTAPATIVAIVKETHSKGVFVKTLIAAVALNNVACIFLFEIAHTAARASLDPATGHGPLDIMIAPFRQLVASGVLGGGAGLALIAATRRVVRPDRLATASMITILLTCGLADYLGVSMLLSCLFLGVTLANITPEKEEIGAAVFDNFEGAILAVFFTLAGMELDLSYAVSGGVLALLMVGARFAGKFIAASLAMRAAGATSRIRQYLGLALVPQAGVAVGLMLVLQEDVVFAPIRDLFLAVGLTVVTINEIVGPVLTRVALVRSGDYGQDRARLIDFLNEENIVTDFGAATKDEAIDQLVSLLIRSNHLHVDPERFRQSVLAREAEFSTCLGNGLAIPHGVVDGGGAICGVMGLSREGLHFDTPDGTPVHCMILLATPPGERDRHLEILAGLAKAITSDRNVQRRLFNAKSPAHAYEILHTEEVADFNYFLDSGPDV